MSAVIFSEGYCKLTVESKNVFQKSAMKWQELSGTFFDSITW